MLGEVEGAVALTWQVRSPTEGAAFQKVRSPPQMLLNVLEPVFAPWWLGARTMYIFAA